MTAEEPNYNLVMPFVVCDDGTYDSSAFVAGYEASHWDQALKGINDFASVTLMRCTRKALVPQIDLIAMKHGFRVTEVDDLDDGWTDVTVTNERPEAEMP